MLLGGFLHILLANLLGRRANNMECKATLRLRFLIWIAIRPNLFVNLQSDSSSAWHKLVKASDVRRCDRLVVY